MSNLWATKEWLTLEEAADVLTIKLGEPVAVLDLLRWGSARRIKLTLKFWTSFWARKFEIKNTTESDFHESLTIRQCKAFFDAPSGKTLKSFLFLWTTCEPIWSDVSQVFWSLPDATRASALDCLSKYPSRKALEVTAVLNSKLHETENYLGKPPSKFPPFHSVSDEQHLQPINNEVEFCGSGFYDFAEHGGIYGLQTKAAMECLGKFEESSGLIFSFFDGIFLVDSNGIYIELLDSLPAEKCRLDNRRHPDNFYPTDFHHNPTICIFPNELHEFVNAHSGKESSLLKQNEAPCLVLRRKSDIQIDEIVNAALSLKFDLMSIPAGGKGRIKAICLINRGAIGSANAFRTAWRNATQAKKIKSVVPGV